MAKKPRVKTKFNAKFFREQANKASIKSLGHAGAYIKKVARNSIDRKGAARRAPQAPSHKASGKASKAYVKWFQEVRYKPASEAPKPPHTHTGFLKEDISFAVEKGRRKNVVVGPYRSPWLNELHEYGGAMVMNIIEDTKRPGTTKLKRAATRLKRTEEKLGTVVAHYPARPFMGPAFRETKSRLPQFWAKSIGNVR